MKLLLRQLRRWRLRERLVRVAWGGARWLAIAGTVLAFACLVDWWLDLFDDVPLSLRVVMTGGQVALAAGLAYLFLVRPWVRTPPVDELAFRAERAIPEFDHRLVTAIQLNRPGAKTHGMSPVLIAEVTREAGEMAARHRLARLVRYRPVAYAAAVVAPVLLGWGAFAAVDPELALVLLKRQALLGGVIPRSVQLENVTQDVWPSGAEVTIRYRVTGEYREDMVGRVYLWPDGQPVDDYPLAFEARQPDGSATFVAKLPPSSVPFTFRARLGDGRTRSAGRVEFEPPPQVLDIEAWQLLPEYLGVRVVEVDGQKGKARFERFQPRGEVVNALPESGIRVEAKFSKPVTKAVLTTVERGDGNREVDGRRTEPDELAADGLWAAWVFPTTPRLIKYRIDLTDARGFTSPAPAVRGVRMMPDEPPFVEFRKESTRNPDPEAFDGKGDPRLYEWDMPVSWRGSAQPGEGDTGPIQVIWSARSELGIGRANLAYRVVPRGEQPENVHPRDDPGGRVYTRLPLSSYTADPKAVGRFVPDLGLFEWSFVTKKGPPRLYLDRFDRFKVQVELYKVPSPSPQAEPGELEAGGRVNFQTAGLRKKVSDGTMAKLEPGDTVELYVEVFDKYGLYLESRKQPGRPGGYTREAKRKTIVTEDEARLLIRQRDESQRKLQDKVRDIADDQRNVFTPAKPKE